MAQAINQQKWTPQIGDRVEIKFLDEDYERSSDLGRQGFIGKIEVNDADRPDRYMLVPVGEGAVFPRPFMAWQLKLIESGSADSYE